MSGPDKVDRLLRDWEEVASTARPPARDPRRSEQAAGALPASMLLVAAVAVAFVAIVGRGSQEPAVGDASEPPSSAVVAADDGRAPVEATTDNGVVRLTLRADHSRYTEGEAIDAEAVVEYVGPDTVYQYDYTGTTPIHFSVAEAGGSRHAEWLFVRTVLSHGQLQPRVPELYPWARVAHELDGDPNKPFADWYMDQDAFRLPAGTWDLRVEFPGADTATVRIMVEPAAAASEPQATADTADAVDEDDRFRLELSTDRAQYAEGEPIEAVAEVTFLGPDADVVGSHGVSPVRFKVMELGGEGRSAGFGPELLPCGSTTFRRDEPMPFPWLGLLSPWQDAPASQAGLPAGRWWLQVELDVTEGPGCDGTTGHELTADLIIDVTVTRRSQPSDPALTDRGAAHDGRFRVELTARGTVFQEGETIRAGAEVMFLGPEGSARVGHGSPPVTFLVEEIGGARRSAGTGTDTVCLSSTFQRDESVPFPWRRGGSWSPDNPSPNDLFTMDYVDGWSGAQEGELRLPPGTWRLSAKLDVDEGECGGRRSQVTASILIRVDPAPGTATPPPEAGLNAGPVVICDGVSAADCEHAVALIRSSGPGPRTDGGAIVRASIWLVADTCEPGATCDRKYPFEATVLWAVPWMVATDAASTVRGVDGPEEVLLGEGFVAPWMIERIEQARELVPVPVDEPRLPEDATECPAGLVTGTIRELESYGLGLESDGRTWPVRWPFGSAARRDDGELVLVDAAGKDVARAGDRIQAAGGVTDAYVGVCGAIVPAPAPEGP